MDAPVFLAAVIALEHLAAGGVAAFLKPFVAFLFLQAGNDALAHFEQVIDIVERVLDHLGRERAFAPIGLLRGFREFDAKVLLNQIAEAETASAEQTGTDLRVVHDGRQIAEFALEHRHVVIRAVHPDGGLAEVGGERFEVVDRQRIDQHRFAVNGKLDQAKGLAVAVEAVGLGVDGANRSTVLWLAFLEMKDEPLGGINHGVSRRGPTGGRERDKAGPMGPANGRNPLAIRRIWCGGFMPPSMVSGLFADKLKLPSEERKNLHCSYNFLKLPQVFRLAGE